MIYHREFDVTDSIFQALKDEGRDIKDLAKSEMEDMARDCLEDYDFNELAEHSMEVLVCQEI